MVPEFDVHTEISYSPDQLPQLTAEDVVHGFTATHGYEPMTEITWTDVLGTLVAEREVLDRARAGARTPEEYEAILRAEESEIAAQDDFDWTYRGIDIGVAGLVYGLNAARGATFYACRGSHDPVAHRGTHPQVGVALDRERAVIVGDLAKEYGCGLIADERGLLWLAARTLEGAYDLAEALAANRSRFDCLDAPTWTDGLEEAYEA